MAGRFRCSIEVARATLTARWATISRVVVETWSTTDSRARAPTPTREPPQRGPLRIQPLVRALLESFLGFLVRVRRPKNGEALDAGRERDRSGDTSPRAFDGVGDVAGGLVDDAMVKGLQSDTNALSSHRKNNFIVMVWLKTLSVPPIQGNGTGNIADRLHHATAF